MNDESTPQTNEDDEQPTGQGASGGDGNVGPAEDIENDPAYNPEQEGLKDLKGG